MSNNVEQLNALFSLHNIKGSVVAQIDGHTITRYEVMIDPYSVEIDSYYSLEENIAYLLQSVEKPIISPIYERSIVAIDVIKSNRTTFTFEEMVNQGINEKCDLPLVLGQDVYNKNVVVDLADMPHLLVAGTTGSGKSVGLRNMITGLKHFGYKVEMILIDPKRVEFSVFKNDPDTIILSESKEVQQHLEYLISRIEARYEAMAQVGVNKISDLKDRSYIIVVIDELADLLSVNKHIRGCLLQIAQKSRAAGVHIIAATQRPSVDIISGVIKNNFPGRIAFKVSSQEDSRTILGNGGAERLLGCGDMLYKKAVNSFERIQAPYIDNNAITKYLQ